MTKQEAIEVIKLAQAQVEWEYPMDYAVAFDMAISALREQLTCNKLQQVATDTISRQAVIDLYKQYQPYMAVKVIEFGKALEQLPYAQPEPCEDAVNRRKLLNDLGELITAWKKHPVMAEQIKGVETAIEYVKTIPSVTPKLKTGRWVIKKGVLHPLEIDGICSKCGYTTGFYTLFNFCPNCGADMRGNKDG